MIQAKKKLSSICISLSLILAACGTVVGNPEEEDDISEPPAAAIAELPELRGISLTNLGTGSAANLTHQDSCAGVSNLGVFGFVYAPACILSDLTGASLYGPEPDKNNDGRITCAEYDPTQEDNGILFALLCEESMTNLSEVTSLRFAENDEEIAIDFSADNDFGLGHWSARGEDGARYPASIRIWHGLAGGDLSGQLAMQLNSGSTGTVYFNIANEQDYLVGDSIIDVKETDALPNCEANPTRDNCHFSAYSFQGKPDDPEGIAGIRMQIYANKREQADFIIVEGEYHYTAAQAEAQFTNDPNTADSFSNIRYIYFRTVQRGGQIWGSFDFKDELNTTISTPFIVNETTVDFTQLLRNGESGEDYAGVCINLGSDEWVDCVDVDHTQYATVWQGDADFNPDAAYSQPVDYATPPEAGLCYLKDGDQTCL